MLVPYHLLCDGAGLIRKGFPLSAVFNQIVHDSGLTLGISFVQKNMF